jgi:hypothetical protein
MLDALRDLPREPLVYELGGIIFASALLGFSHAMRHLLRTIGRGGLWILPLLGALLVLAAVVLHGYAWYILMPTAAAGEVPGMQQAVYHYRFIALLAMLLASLLTLSGALGLWLMFNGSRRKA